MPADPVPERPAAARGPEGGLRPVQPADPRKRPALAVTAGSEVVPGSYSPGRFPREVLFGDGQWHPVEVQGRWRDHLGRQVWLVEWHDAAGTWSAAYRIVPGTVREPSDADPPARDSRREPET